MPMSPRLLRPRASGVHPEAAAWRSAVVANGGSVSATTMQAVDRFCRDIDANGLRSLLWRVNPMAGDNLSAALVPLYRANSSSGAVQGNATDTNDNFVSGDYDPASGLLGNGSTKRLNTGLPQNFADGRHLGMVPHTLGSTAFRYYMGAKAASSNNALFAIFASSPTTQISAYTYSDAAAIGQGGSVTAVARRLHLISNVAGSGNSRMYADGVRGGTDGLGHNTTNTGAIGIFAARNDDGTGALFSNARIAGYTIGRDMTAAQVTTYNTIWTTLLTALGRVEPQASNADAQDWINRVYANGGTVSASTAAAVNTFCNDIDAAGLRDRFYRLNLFCGTGLSAALVPLYRGRSRTGSQFGNTTETNNGPFVSGDYAETGSSGGLKSDGATKFLNTGFKAPSASASPSDFHIGVYAQGVEAGGTSRFFMGMATNQAGSNLTSGIGWVTSGAVSGVAINETTFLNGGATDRQGMLLAVNDGNRNTIYYDDGTSVATHSGARTDGFETGTGDEFYILARNFVGTTQLYSLNKRIRAYSIGLAMTSSQVTAFQTAMVTFQTALSRNV